MAALLSLVCDQPVEADVGRIVKGIVEKRREGREKREILEFLGVILELDAKFSVVREDVKSGKVVKAAEGLRELKGAIGVKGGGDTVAEGEPAVYAILRKQWADCSEEVNWNFSWTCLERNRLKKFDFRFISNFKSCLQMVLCMSNSMPFILQNFGFA